MPLDYSEWRRPGGWKVTPQTNNPWNLNQDDILTFHGNGLGVLGTDVIKNQTQSDRQEADEGRHSLVPLSTTDDQVVVKRGLKTYTIKRTFNPTQLTCNGGKSGGNSWVAVEGG